MLKQTFVRTADCRGILSRVAQGAAEALEPDEAIVWCRTCNSYASLDRPVSVLNAATHPPGRGTNSNAEKPPVSRGFEGCWQWAVHVS